MHLAVCDDNIADRKQMERLLGRESDRRLKTTGVLYVDSYGSKNSILMTPIIYDAIFIDMTEDCDGVELAHMLRADGNNIPLVFCCGKVNYRESQNLPENVYFLDKPIIVQELSEIIDVLEDIREHKVKRFEFRTETETYYLTEEDIMYAYEDGRYMHIHLKSGKDTMAVISLDNFCANLTSCQSLILVNCHYVLNMNYIKDVSTFKVSMNDGHDFKISLGEKKLILKEVEQYKKRK